MAEEEILPGKPLAFEKSFRFLPWSIPRKIGRLSRFVMVDHCGPIIAHGRELRNIPQNADL